MVFSFQLFFFDNYILSTHISTFHFILHFCYYYIVYWRCDAGLHIRISKLKWIVAAGNVWLFGLTDLALYCAHRFQNCEFEHWREKNFFCFFLQLFSVYSICENGGATICWRVICILHMYICSNAQNFFWQWILRRIRQWFVKVSTDPSTDDISNSIPVVSVCI